MKRIFLCITLLIVLLLNYNLSAISLEKNVFSFSDGSGSYRDETERQNALKYATKIKEVIEAENFEEFANMIHYPITINDYYGEGKYVVVENKEQFLKLDKKIVFNEHLKKSLKTNEIFVNWQGFMIGNGDIWFDTVYPHTYFKIKAINGWVIDM